MICNTNDNEAIILTGLTRCDYMIARLLSLLEFSYQFVNKLIALVMIDKWID